ncbi:hypothetical protein B0H16DRAFT_1830183 [Mycena metata]|uniref:Cytochrome b5 heme-binding domain-containing protein n=1 Tax=Mycena metata TaxID=1033252 RepID=A0AAD7K964_9AGAR|nr:hypothetical protein B0H16DRAFT_1830183 [Mycena metata]
MHPRDDLAPPKDDPFTLAQLAEFDGSGPSKPVYVAIKGAIFDVTPKADVYGVGRSYNIFAGKDGLKGLRMSSLNAVPDYRGLNEAHRKVLDDWHAFFTYAVIPFDPAVAVIRQPVVTVREPSRCKRTVTTGVAHGGHGLTNDIESFDEPSVDIFSASPGPLAA